MSRFSAWKISQFSARALRFGPRKTLAVRLQQCERLAARGKGLSSPKRRFCWGDPLRGALCTSVISWHSCAKTTQYLWLKKAYLMMIPFDWDFLEVARPSIAFSSSFRSWTRDWLRVVEWRRSPENLEDSSLNTASYGCFIVSAMTKRTFQKGLHRKAVTVCFISSWKAGKSPRISLLAEWFEPLEPHCFSWWMQSGRLTSGARDSLLHAWCANIRGCHIGHIDSRLKIQMWFWSSIHIHLNDLNGPKMNVIPSQYHDI